MNNNLKIGNGYDAHQLVKNRPLVIGGVTIDWHLGLDGHSDGDVLLHALCDACLGAAGLGDIGQHFPSSDKYKDADSRVLLREVQHLLAAQKLSVVNVDCIVVAEAPKLTAHLPQMRAGIAADLAIDVADVNVKATTTDGLGFCGRGEGIAAYAVVLLARAE